jgi:hypothetical protein
VIYAMQNIARYPEKPSRRWGRGNRRGMKEGHLFERCRRILVPPCELKPSWRYRQDDIDIQRYFSISYHQPLHPLDIRFLGIRRDRELFWA